MKVSGPSGVGQAGQARGAKSAAAPGFAPIRPGAVSETAPATAASSVSAVSSLEALIALQEVGGPLERKRRAVNRAGRLLDALEDIKLGMLGEGASRASLEALGRAIREQRSSTDDPGLEGVLNEIETRAAVELAKLEMARTAA
ncbi:MAG: flagellar assembly protein FliX [Caulobacteraceae bacterium]